MEAIQIHVTKTATLRSPKDTFQAPSYRASQQRLALLTPLFYSEHSFPGPWDATLGSFSTGPWLALRLLSGFCFSFLSHISLLTD